MVLQIFLYRKAASWPTVIVGNKYNAPNVNHCISAPYRAGVIESSRRRLRWPSLIAIYSLLLCRLMRWKVKDDGAVVS